MSLRTFAGALLLLIVPGAAFAAIDDDIKALVEAGKPAEAYRLGAAHPEAWGNPGFDFYFGVAAIDAGHAGQGVLALERFLLNFPDNDRARLELARGYFVLQEDARAREELEAVRAKSPPASVIATIDRYLEAIRAREGRFKTTARFYVEAGIGSDSNVNGGVGNPDVTLPVLGNVTVSPAGTRRGDMFHYFGAGGQVVKPVAAGVSVFGALDASLKANTDTRTFDQQTLNLGGGASLLRDKDLFRATFSQGVVDVENDRFRTATGVGGEWHRQLSELRTVSTVAQYATLAYPGANQVRDARVSGLGIGLREGFALRWQPIVSGSMNYSEERNTEGRLDLSRNVVAARVGVNLSPDPKWGLSAAYTYNDGRYRAADPILLQTRHDKQTAVELAAIYLYSRQLSLRAELFWTDNRSNLALYQFDRTMAMFKVRYEF